MKEYRGPEWTVDIKIGIEVYRRGVLPFLEQNNYIVARFQCLRAIVHLDSGFQKFGETDINNYTISSRVNDMLADMSVLAKDCRTGDYEIAKNAIDQIIDTVDLSVSSLVEEIKM